jgi:uncharacterized membrane protein
MGESGLLSKLSGEHFLMAFLIAAAAGFAAVYVDVYVLNKIESMVGISATTY